MKVTVDGEVEWLRGHDRDLYRFVHEEERPFLLVGRNSSASGSTGYMAAASDLHGAAASLAALGGLDVRHLLPPVRDLAEMVRTRARTEVNATPEGHRFVNRFILGELVGTGVLFSLSTGTGSMVSDDLEQPHASTLERYVREITPKVAGVFAKRTDRYCRTVHGHTRLYDRLEVMDRQQGVWAGDGHAGRWEFDKPHTPLLLSALATFGANEAKILRVKSQTSQLGLTGERMKNGRVWIGVPRGTPAGTMRYEDAETGRTVLAIDTPSNYPSEVEGFGLPCVIGPDGDRADQEALIRSLFSQWGRDGIDPIDVFGELAAAGLSTHGLRQHNKLSTSFLGAGHGNASSASSIASHFAMTMRRNLSFYETGVLVVSVGGVSKEIHGCFPASGSWASAEDWARIRLYEQDRAARLGKVRKSRWTSSGWQDLEVTVNGEEARLRGRDRTETALQRRGPGVDWAVDRVGRVPGERRSFVPEEALNASIREAFRRAENEYLSSYSMKAATADAVAAEERRRAIASRLHDVAAQRTALVDRLLSVDGCSEAMTAEIKRRDSALTVEETTLILEQRSLDVESIIARQHVGADSTDLTKIVAFLQGRHEPGVSDAMRRAVRGLCFVRQEGSHSRVPVTWSGELVLDDGRTQRGLWRIPFDGSFDIHEDETATGVVSLMSLLRTGEVTRLSHGALANTKAELLAHLDLGSRQLKAAGCNEPELVRLWTAAQFPTAVPGEDPDLVRTVDDLMADESFTDVFGGPEATRPLADRVQAMASEPDKGGWLRPASRIVTKAVIRSNLVATGVLASRRPASKESNDEAGKLLFMAKKTGQDHRWAARRGHWPRLAPCSFCGGTWCVPMRIREVTGYLCLDPGCRRDEAGVRFPPNYDAYVSGVELLVDAGVKLTLPDDFDASWRGLNQRDLTGIDLVVRKRAVKDLTEEEREAMVNGYLCGERLRDLFDRHHIDRRDAYRHLDSQGVPRRSRRSVHEQRTLEPGSHEQSLAEADLEPTG